MYNECIHLLHSSKFSSFLKAAHPKTNCIVVVSQRKFIFFLIGLIVVKDVGCVQ